jgi:hypothetical protein
MLETPGVLRQKDISVLQFVQILCFVQVHLRADFIVLIVVPDFDV